MGLRRLFEARDPRSSACGEAEKNCRCLTLCTSMEVRTNVQDQALASANEEARSWKRVAPTETPSHSPHPYGRLAPFSGIEIAARWLMVRSKKIVACGP